MILLLTFLLTPPAHAIIEPFLGDWTTKLSNPGIYVNEKIETGSVSQGRCESVIMRLTKNNTGKLNLVIKYTCGRFKQNIELLNLQVYGSTLFYGDRDIGIDRGKSLLLKYDGYEINLSVAVQVRPYLTISKETNEDYYNLKAQLDYKQN